MIKSTKRLATTSMGKLDKTPPPLAYASLLVLKEKRNYMNMCTNQLIKTMQEIPSFVITIISSATILIS